jgi:GH25 family lysozyme M1 (1,4-beta-N-acetylmuramidase)
MRNASSALPALCAGLIAAAMLMCAAAAPAFALTESTSAVAASPDPTAPDPTAPTTAPVPTSALRTDCPVPPSGSSARRLDPAIPDVPAGTMFGVDIASPQAGIDLQRFAGAGGRFAIIKQGGGNASDSPYVAPRYEEQLAGARAAGLPVGHYWFNGQKLSIEGQARFFVEHARVEPGDVVALDIEDEPETCTRAFTPREAERWITEVQKTYPGLRVLLYLNLKLLRGHDWSELTRHPLWVAAWGQNDGTIPDEPTLKWWDDWAIWQYSSVLRVPGLDRDIDGNIAKLDLFTQYGWSPQPNALT